VEILRKIGAAVLEVLAYVGALASLTGRAAYFTFLGPFLGVLSRGKRMSPAATRIVVQFARFLVTG